MDKASWQKLAKIDNPPLFEFIAKYIEFCNPKSVFVSTNSKADLQHIRDAALKYGEEKKLAIDGHTYHFDSFFDQARDKKNTLILIPDGEKLGAAIATKERETGLAEVHEILKDIMNNKELFACFYCLGPVNSPFTVPCVQLTDSAYVAHNENLLYRPGYDEFVRLGEKARFLKFVHSAGELDERKVSKNLDNRRVFIDIHDDTVYSVNTQYGGNSIGLKKLAMRLTIYHASKQGWLTEHMLVLGARGPKNRITYFTGAYPSLCGKTSTAMMEGESMIGDDIALIRKINGKVRAVNYERGMFGIIQGVNSKDDPLLWKALNSPGEIIFSNVLVTEDGKTHWIGRDGEVPSKGINHSGDWFIGKKDANGKDITPSHPNARFTLSLDLLDNLDSHIDDAGGVEVGGFVYGGRDSDICVPVEEAFDWTHGIITKGAILESETTAATLGKEGVREINPMANLDFLSIPVGRYIQINLDFAKGLKNPPLIFGVNYFLKDKGGKFLNTREDKRVWFKWMELRVHNEVGAINTPTGRIPKYEDLKKLFKKVLKKNYTKDDYTKQFTIRVPELLAKIERTKKFYETQVFDTPKILFDVLEQQKKRLLAAKEKFGDYVKPQRLKVA